MGDIHQIYLALGANLGDRQSNIIRALQYIRGFATIERTSSFYETKPVGYQDQPDFINCACLVSSQLCPEELLHALKHIEQQMGRQTSFRNAPRPIDIDILLYDDLVVETEELTIPHPRLDERAFVLVPLAEIAPHVVHPLAGLTIDAMLRKVDLSGVHPWKSDFHSHLNKDMQKEAPTIPISISQVGVTGLRRILRIHRKGQENLFYAELDLFADLDARQMGVHMSRFSDILQEVIDEVTLEASPSIESLAKRIAEQVMARQDTIRSEVNVRAIYPMAKTAPVSGKKMQELYTLIGIAVSSRQGSKHIVGVEAEGMTVCPCAQEMVRSYSRERLIEQGFTGEQADLALSVIPIASHNQRGRGTLMIGCDQDIDAEDLVHIVESSMSAETYDLLKRSDELFMVTTAHNNPRFVEDVVREMIQNVLEVYSRLPDTTFILAKQVNLESIHKHDAFAELHGTLGEIRREALAGERLTHHLSLQEWLRD